jgi:hypothetical protein
MHIHHAHQHVGQHTAAKNGCRRLAWDPFRSSNPGPTLMEHQQQRIETTSGENLATSGAGWTAGHSRRGGPLPAQQAQRNVSANSHGQGRSRQDTVAIDGPVTDAMATTMELVAMPRPNNGREGNRPWRR